MIAKIAPGGLGAHHVSDGLKVGLYLHWLHGRFGKVVMTPETRLSELTTVLKAAGRPLTMHFAAAPVGAPKTADLVKEDEVVVDMTSADGSLGFEFKGKGAIGIIFAQRDQQIIVGKLIKEGQAIKKYSEEIRPGMILTAVEGDKGRKDIEYATVEQATQMIKKAGKPLTLHFDAKESVETLHSLMLPWIVKESGPDEDAFKMRLRMLMLSNFLFLAFGIFLMVSTFVTWKRELKYFLQVSLFAGYGFFVLGGFGMTCLHYRQHYPDWLFVYFVTISGSMITAGVFVLYFVVNYSDLTADIEIEMEKNWPAIFSSLPTATRQHIVSHNMTKTSQCHPTFYTDACHEYLTDHLTTEYSRNTLLSMSFVALLLIGATYWTCKLLSVARIARETSTMVNVLLAIIGLVAGMLGMDALFGIAILDTGLTTPSGRILVYLTLGIALSLLVLAVMGIYLARSQTSRGGYLEQREFTPSPALLAAGSCGSAHVLLARCPLAPVAFNY